MAIQNIYNEQNMNLINNNFYEMPSNDCMDKTMIV